MLVLSRDRDSAIRIGPDITVKVLSIGKQRVKIGVDAPSSLRIWRDEIAPPDDSEETLSPSISPSIGEDFPVLVVEDDPDQAELIARVLATNNVPSVTVVRSGSEALRALLPENGHRPPFRPSLILLDLNLPDIPGIDVLRRVRQTDRLAAVPIVVLTAHCNDDLIKSCLASGANAYVRKATKLDEFVQSIGRITAFWSHDHCAADV